MLVYLAKSMKQLMLYGRPLQAALTEVDHLFSALQKFPLLIGYIIVFQCFYLFSNVTPATGSGVFRVSMSRDPTGYNMIQHVKIILYLPYMISCLLVLLRDVFKRDACGSLVDPFNHLVDQFSCLLAPNKWVL